MFLVVLVTICALIGGNVASTVLSLDTCPAVEKVGCYRDTLAGRQSGKLKLIRDVNYRSKIDWTDPVGYQQLLARLSCDCAKAASNNGVTYFGLQYWGECWVGDIRPFTEHGPQNVCRMPSDTEFNPTCQDDSDSLCVGVNWSNYVYRLVSKAPCADKDQDCPKYEDLCDNDNYDVKDRCPLTCNNCP